MEFSSVEFLAFLLITIFLFYLVKARFRWMILLVASFVFIYTFSIKLLLFTTGFAILNYAAGIAISKSKTPQIKSLCYHFGIWLNIGVLVFYKYANFLLENLISIFEKTPDKIETPVLSLIVPIGISFYTFQSIGYLIDVKRGTKPAETNLARFILFILYFPKFISGPVERTGNLLPKINRELKWYVPMFNEGILQMLWGFFKTIVISDRLAIIVNSVNGNLEGTPGTLLLINFFVQFFYLYFNFSGYTDIVLGISKVFQVDLLNNFNRPLFATSVSDYWRRWHISLTTWCNDYIFKRIILKRIKWGQWASVYAVIITFLIIGIWHGANWNFIILGLLQGLAINYEFFTRKQRSSLGQKIPLWLNLTLSRLFTLIFICVSHVFFFTKDIQEALFYFSNMFQFSNPNLLSTNPGLSLKDMVIVSSAFLLVIISEFRDERGMKSIKTTIIHNKIYFFLVVAVAVAVLLLAGIFKGSGFIYEQF